MERDLKDNLFAIEYRIKQIETLLLALIERIDDAENRKSHIKYEYQNKAKKLNIRPDYPD